MKKILIFLTLCFICILPHSKSLASSYADERQASDSFMKVINADIAHTQGYTGKGVTVGVIDSIISTHHKEIGAKTELFNNEHAIDWRYNTHGTHVGGIIAASRNGLGMHGVAYDAMLKNSGYLNSRRGVGNYPFDFEDFVADFPDDYDQPYPNVRILNNSWGSSIVSYSITADSGTPYALLSRPDYLSKVQGDFIKDVIDYALKDPGAVMVFAAGNSGRFTPDIESKPSHYYGPALSNWINVSGLNSANIEVNGNVLNFNEKSIYTYSNLAVGAERYTIYAPGENIYSLDARTGGYMLQSGTSMATPVVSGALALVAQKYPWLTGKQLADTVLTTANDDFLYNGAALGTGDFFVLKSEDFVEHGLRTTIYEIIDATHADHGKLSTLDATAAAGYGISIDPGTTILHMYLTKEEIFGRGVLDVGKAIGGIALLDANRMVKDNVVTIAELGGVSHALEVFDTNRYSAEFSNDIGEEKWNDDYHHADFKTTGSENEHAIALDGKAVGLLKKGEGELILQGTNTYTGASVVEQGVLGLMKRTDNTGGVLTHSEVVVGKNGTFWSQGGQVDNALHNNGTVHISSVNPIGLTVNNYTQSADATLRVDIDPDGNNAQINATGNPAALNGALLFTPVADFYSEKNLTLDVFTATSAFAGNFTSSSINDVSPTLQFALQQLDVDRFSLSVQRPDNAYSQYAEDENSSDLGNVLDDMATIAQGDMENLINALDFSNPNGGEVSSALKQLGPQSYDALSQVSIEQQRKFNNLMVKRMLSKARQKANPSVAQNTQPNLEQASSGMSAGAAMPSNASWQVWGQAVGSIAHQGSFDNVAGYSSSTVGFMMGADHSWNSGLTAGLHVGLTHRNTTALGDIEANTDTESFTLGLQAHLSPDSWDGLYILGQTRFGFEQNTMLRTVEFNNFARQNTSQWTDFVGSVLLGGGKDWTINNLRLGPLAWIEYSFMQRPDITEEDGQSTRLNIDGYHYDSLQSVLGLHLGTTQSLSDSVSLDLDLLATWQHELLEGNVTTQTSFADYSGLGFKSDTPLIGRNTYGLQASFRLNHIQNYFVQLDIGGEITDANGQALNLGFKIGYNF